MTLDVVQLNAHVVVELSNFNMREKTPLSVVNLTKFFKFGGVEFVGCD